jgi:hypothetical protein
VVFRRTDFVGNCNQSYTKMENSILRFILYAIFEGVIFTAFLAIFIFLFKEKFKALIQYSIKHLFDMKLEDYKSRELKRQKAILIADLLAEWISKPEDYRKLNQLTLEAFIWLPKETAIRLSDLLAHKPGAPNVREVIAEVREIIMGEEEKIDFTHVIIFKKV